MLVDTHCHVHEHDYPDTEGAIARALAADVTKLLCVGVNEESSRQAVECAGRYDSCYAVVGVHPHDTKDGYDYIEKILIENHRKVIGVGEIGLDYFYNHSPRKTQIKAIEQQLQWAVTYNLPVSFHVREASSAQRRTSVWSDFWPILDNFHGIRGVLHSFTDTQETLDQGLSRGLYIGVNGISTFTKSDAQKAMFAALPLEKMLLETDAPFLTPAPKRGTVNEPAFVKYVATHHATIRGTSPEEIARITSANASALFAL